jgi:hypothetical protein
MVNEGNNNTIQILLKKTQNIGKYVKLLTSTLVQKFEFLNKPKN